MGDNSAKVVAPVIAWLDASLVNVSGECCITLPASLIPFIVGAIEEYKLPDMWTGEDNDIIYAIKVFETLSAELSAVISNCGTSASNCGCASQCEDTSYMANKCVPLSIKDGKLYWNNGCEEIEIPGKLGETSGKEEIPDVEPTEPEPQADLRCLKANIVADLIWRVSEAIGDVIESTYPQNYIHEVEKRANIQLDTPGMMGTWGVYWTYRLLLSDFLGADLSDTQKSDFICKFSQVADGGTSNVSDKEMDRIHATLAQALGIDVIATGFFENVVLAIGKARIQQAVNMAASAAMEFDCPCINGGSADAVPDGMTWTKVFDFKLGTYGFVPYVNPSNHHEMGVGFVTDALDGGGANVPQFYRAAGADTPVPPTIMYVRLHIPVWPNSLSVGGGSPSIFAPGNSWWYEDATMRGKEWPTISANVAIGFGTTVRFGWNEWFNGAGNNPYRAVVDRLILAGVGNGDGFVGLQPDGTWEMP